MGDGAVTILFDLDGTLIDSTEAILESFHRAFAAVRDDVPEDAAITALIGHPLDVMFAELGVAESCVWDYVARYKEHYRAISKQKTVMLPHAVEAIEHAARFATLGVVTTKTARYSKELLTHFGVMHRFAALIGREDVTHPKPHPEPIEKAIAAIGGDRSTYWMIGDTTMDIEAANAAKIASIAVCCGYASKEELSGVCDIVVDDAKAAVAYLADV